MSPSLLLPPAASTDGAKRTDTPATAPTDASAPPSSSSSSSLPPALLQRARSLTAEHDSLQRSLQTSFDPSAARRAGELARVATALHAYDKSTTSVAELSALLSPAPATADDAELAAIARDELAAERETLSALSAALASSLTPRDPYAALPCMLEFRPGPGGTESRYFTDTLFRMYQALCARRGYAASVVKYELADAAGDKSSAAGELPLQEAVLEVADPGAYDVFRTEAGMHRVQRIPSTEAKGRVHTSAAALWVLPLFPESGGEGSGFDVDDPSSDFYIDPQECRVETMRARGAGGQHVNKTESAIRITHVPSGQAVSMQDHRSQARNRDAAWTLLRSRVADQRRAAREVEAAALRDSVLTAAQVHRGEKIRTYNYNQDRCTDHRAGIDVHNLPNVLEGGETLDRVMGAAKEWMAQRDLDNLIRQEEAKAKKAAGKEGSRR